MKQRTNHSLYNYWNEVRGQRIAPRRFDIEPGRIASILPETFILERHDARAFRFRLAGTRICEQFGHEMRNRDFASLFPPADRYGIEDLLVSVADRGGVALAEAETMVAGGGSGRCEMLVLPLTDTNNVVTRFLGAMSCYDAPNWLEPGPMSIRSIIRSELVWPDGRPHALIESGRHPAPFQAKPAAVRIVKASNRQFRVFDGGLAGTAPPRR